jgi:cell wall-associated NlpC family hydrolase
LKGIIIHIALTCWLLLKSGFLLAQPDTVIQLHLLPKTSDSLTLKPRQKLQADSLVKYAYSFMGDRYRRGGTSTKGFDCSGFTMTVFAKFGVKLPHTSAGQSFIGVEVSKKQISKGDLIFFRGRNSRRRGIGHVGIVISEKGKPVEFIHSSTSAGVRIDRLDSEYYRKRYMKTTRVLPLK